MFIVLYRWRVRAEMEIEFTEAWSEITEYFRAHFDSLGSRLHRGDDGLFYGYARWKSAEQRDNAFAADNPEIESASIKMRQAIEESLPEIVLRQIADYLV